MSATTQAGVSLLYPAGVHPAQPGHPAQFEADLGLTMVARALDLDGRHGRFISGLLAELNTDPAVIHYRQEIVDDLVVQPELASQIAAILPPLRQLAEVTPSQRWDEGIPLLRVAARLAELDCYVTCVEGLAAALDSHPRAAGLLRLRSMIAGLRANQEYERLAAELPDLRSEIERAGSVTLGINLDPQLRPESATIVSVNTTRFVGKGTLLDRLLGERVASETIRGITALYKADEAQPHTPSHDLFRDLNRLLERVAAPVADALGRYTRMNTRSIALLEPELTFYLGAARLVRTLRDAGLPLVRPEIAPIGERACVIEGSYNLELALRLRNALGQSAAEAIVPSDVDFHRGAEIAILTGPNSGGKTTYLRAVGQALVLFQAGLPVPGHCARLSPVDAIFTHFAAPERLSQDGGRLAEEMARMAQIFAAATRDSFVLLNEPFTSTDYQSARLILGDVVAGLRLLGARAILVTHLRELATDALQEVGPGAGIFSLVAGVAETAGQQGEPAPTYRVERGLPQAARNATELARRFGLSRRQITEQLHERGLVLAADGGNSRPHRDGSDERG